MLILCIGDLHIPHRACDLPQQFKELLKPGKIHSILSTGNLCCKSFIDYLKNLTSDIHLVQGDFDEFTSPESSIVNLGGFKIGISHGHQVVPWGDTDRLGHMQRQMDVDILITGHTHEYKVTTCGSGLQINPGSATGAYSTCRNTVTPSFVLLDLDGSKATVYVYQLVDGKVKVEKVDYVKPT
ncbi:hypothetical protein CEUSTIGMA_g9291.t1 [Chlamydomonas eustigma]|uniref:Vacuolar protein sorting-associated protein 29 n=1 Tax=Chlamydomonas eustigma TaxID=1157962 RepID=A0A250XFM9_9CHLO|nr:hypothetical protein CEUSTIGMA_g9291.t1 [Chlamydomonas eustigma]|eukprot:GAX81863.1 hypothetical protein CEUSTIGMA_g9291.t1 [Chlamydomonas eustigma]